MQALVLFYQYDLATLLFRLRYRLSVTLIMHQDMLEELPTINPKITEGQN